MSRGKGPKVAIIGADGQLGSDLFEELGQKHAKPLYYPDFDLTDPVRVENILCRLNPDVVINTAAFNRVDESESNPLEAFKINAIAVRDLARVCRKLGSILVHFSSDYVFSGTKKSPYTEQDSPHPLSVYGLSKLSGEIFVFNELRRFYLIRTCGLFGKAGCWGKGRNFVDAMVDVAENKKPVYVVGDQTITPTATSELSKRVIELLSTDKYGLYHMTNEGQCTWFELAREIFALLQKDVQLTEVDSETYGAAARRPAYSVLSNRKAYRAGVHPFSPWREALKIYMKKKGFLEPDVQTQTIKSPRKKRDKETSR
jgi:dTDP-4-dehydrorhamnose reductase